MKIIQKVFGVGYSVIKMNVKGVSKEFINP
jgi:hypothetical protein